MFIFIHQKNWSLPTLKILLFLLVLFTTPSLFGQSYQFRHYQVENGLSNNAVISSLQDRKGFMWFGTKDGLNRFDGYSFRTFRSNPSDSGSLGNHFIYALYEAPDGSMWIGTEKGLYQYNATTEHFRLVQGTADFQISEITSDSKGNLWFISGFTLFTYHRKNKTLQHYPTDLYFEATAVCTTPDGNVWAATSNGQLKKLKKDFKSFLSFDVYQHSATVTSKWIEKIYSTHSNSIWIGTQQGAKWFDVTNGTYKDITLRNESKTDLFVRNFLQTSDSVMWMGTESGIFIYNLQSGQSINLRKRYNDRFSLSDNAVYTFCQDKEGGIWAGTYFGGINYHPQQYTPFQKWFPKTGENSLSGNVVREIQEDANGHLWIGTEDAGLNKFNRTTGQFTHFAPIGTKGSLSYSNIHGLLVHNNELWIGTFEHGLDVMNIETGKVTRHYSTANQPHLKSNFIYCLSQSATGEIMMGTTIGAYAFDTQKELFTPIPSMPVYNWYTALKKDEEGIIWAGTFGNGVNYYHTKTGKSGNYRFSATDRNSLGSDRVNAIFEDSRKNLWFATEGGLNLFDRTKGTFKRITTEDGLPSNFTIALLEDEKANLWVSTTKGLVCYNTDTEKMAVYTIANGLLSDQFNFSSAYKDKANRMYFGSARGLISFQPRAFAKNNYIPPVYITGFQVFNEEMPITPKGSVLTRSVTYTDKLVLPYNQSTFSIDFAALTYTAPQMTEYAYILQGLDKGWTYLKTKRKAYFTQLAAGTYHFKVKATNSNGIWNGQETTLTIVVLPPWWATWWAHSLYALTALALAIFGIRSYHKHIEEKNRRKIELLKIAKEKEIYEAKIEFFTNVAHEIKTPLTLIKGPLEKVTRKAGDIPELKNSLKIMNRNADRLVDLTNQLLDFRQTEIKGFTLQFTRVNISEMVEETYASFQPLADEKNMAYQLNLPAAVLYATVDAEAFTKILTNLFSNALKYAAQQVSVHLLPIDAGSKMFTIEVKNDGFIIPMPMREKIFEPFFRLKETEKQKGTGIGLALSRSLTLLHNGVLELKKPERDLNVFALTLPIQQKDTLIISEDTAASFTNKNMVS